MLRLPDLAVIRAQIQVIVGGGHELFWTIIPRHDRQGVNVLRTQAAAGFAPGLAAVPAAIQAVDLHSGPDGVRLAGIVYQRGDACVDESSAVLDDAHRRLAPSATAVLRPKQPRWTSSGQDRAIDVRQQQQRPDLQPVEWGFDAGPALRTVGAMEQAQLATEVQRARVAWMRDQGTDMTFNEYAAAGADKCLAPICAAERSFTDGADVQTV